MKTTDHVYDSFGSWLISQREMAEKTIGVVVLTVESIALFSHVFGDLSRPVITQLLNFFLLLFLFFYLRKSFDQRYVVNADSSVVARILRFSPEPEHPPVAGEGTTRPTEERTNTSEEREEIRRLVADANTLISQLKNINYFILATALLYVLLLAQSGARATKTQSEGVEYFFHLSTDFVSYVGAFFLLRCFYVMYLPTVENGKDVLRKKTNIYILIVFFLMVFDVVVTFNNRDFGVFISEFVCGLVNAVVLIFLFARFENKILDTPTWVLALLYLYAALQTSLPFVTGNFLVKGLEGEPHSGFLSQLISFLQSLNTEENSFRKFLGEFNSVVLTFCLIGKVALAAVLLYLLKSKRIFYYFMTLKKIHEEEEENWTSFKDQIEDFSASPKTYRLEFESLAEGRLYRARIPGLFDLFGEGSTPAEAEGDLVHKLKDRG